MPSPQDWEGAPTQRWPPGRNRDISSWHCWLQKVPSLILDSCRGTGCNSTSRLCPSASIKYPLSLLWLIPLPFVSKFAKLLCLTCTASCGIWSSTMRIADTDLLLTLSLPHLQQKFFLPLHSKGKSHSFPIPSPQISHTPVPSPGWPIFNPWAVWNCKTQSPFHAGRDVFCQAPVFQGVCQSPQ